jgi:two-component system sensor histidine kinase YesM
LVENAVLHGIHQKRGTRCVSIGFTAKEKVILLRVWDNGPGIPPDKLARIRSDLDSGDFAGRDSYGLKNVHERIRLKYEGDYGLRIASRYRGAEEDRNAFGPSGTIVTIRLPRGTEA